LPSARKGEHLTRGELAYLFVHMFQLDEREGDEKLKMKEKSSIENISTGSLSSAPTEEKAGSKSRRDTFQELMKIQ
jgi:hypothetical protein